MDPIWDGPGDQPFVPPPNDTIIENPNYGDDGPDNNNPGGSAGGANRP